MGLYCIFQRADQSPIGEKNSPNLVTLSDAPSFRVARWFIFKPKIRICVDFGGHWNGKCWYILSPLEIFYGHLE
jgi:hypothetical protein